MQKAKPSSLENARPNAVPVGPRLERVLTIAYRARRAVLLEGPTGIGKSEIVHAVAQRLGIETRVLDLSLLEPPDLVGLPRVENGRTVYALPSIFPAGGAGILLLEELNRAERYIQQPALQLLSARRLHDYELPAGWICVATINPQTSDYHVTALDKALRARFLGVPVRADRATFLAWGEKKGLHPGVLALARAHERILDDVPPRTWTYVSELLSVLDKDEIADGGLLRDALSGTLPIGWVEALLASRDGWQKSFAFDVRALLSRYDTDPALAREIVGYREGGKTDRIDEIVARLAPLLEGPEAGVLVAERSLTLASIEAFMADLPGDQRHKLQEALGKNATATPLVDVGPHELLQGYAGSAAQRKLDEWKADPKKHHRVALAITSLRAHVEDPARLADLKKSNVARTCLGHLLAGLREEHAMPLVDTLRRVGITPVRPA